MTDHVSQYLVPGYIVRAPYDYVGRGPGPINWSDIIGVTKLDVTNPGSDALDGRDFYYLEINRFALVSKEVWDFGLSHEMRDAVYDAIVQTKHPPS
jgi:hypothetical protein